MVASMYVIVNTLYKSNGNNNNNNNNNVSDSKVTMSDWPVKRIKPQSLKYIRQKNINTHLRFA